MKTLELTTPAPDLYDEDDGELDPGNAVIPGVGGYGVDPADYDNDTDYINAIPGMAERLIKSMNAPMSEFEPAPESSFRA